MANVKEAPKVNNVNVSAPTAASVTPVATATPVVAAPVKPSALAALLLAKKTTRLTKPNIVKPESLEIGVPFGGYVVGIEDSMTPQIKGKLLRLLKLDPETAVKTDVEVLLPVTGTIRKSLCPGLVNSRDDDDEKVKGEELKAALQIYIGKTLIFTRQPSQLSAKFKKEMFMFDVDMLE